MHHRNYTQVSHVEALSIYNHQSHLKKGEKPPRKHLLGLLSSFTKEDADVRC